MRIVQTWINRIIQPSTSILDNREFRRVRLLIAMTLALIALTLIGVLFTGRYVVNAFLVIAAAIMFFSYGLNKTRFYKAGAYFLTFGLAFPSFALILIESDPPSEVRILSAAVWIPASLVIAALWLSWKETLLITAILIALLQSLGLSIEWATSVGSSSYNGISALLFVVGLVMALSSYLVERDQKQITHQNSMLENQTEQLILARDQALEANHFKSELLSKVSHELRTPLGAILGYSQLMSEEVLGPVSDQQTEKLSEIVDSVNYLTALVDELLDQGQLAAGKLVTRTEPFAPRQVLEQVSGKMRVLARDKDLALTIDIDADVPATLCGDPIQVQQILVNLIGNSIKFTEHGGVNVHVDTVNNTHWVLRVSDTGSGIPKAFQARIFDPFEQVDGSVTRTHSGTGLGLAIVKQLTTLMGGQVSLDSEVGQGSTFTVQLPIIKAQDE